MHISSFKYLFSCLLQVYLQAFELSDFLELEFGFADSVSLV